MGHLPWTGLGLCTTVSFFPARQYPGTAMSFAIVRFVLSFTELCARLILRCYLGHLSRILDTELGFNYNHEISEKFGSVFRIDGPLGVLYLSAVLRAAETHTLVVQGSLHI